MCGRLGGGAAGGAAGAADLQHRPGGAVHLGEVGRFGGADAEDGQAFLDEADAGGLPFREVACGLL